MGERFSLSRPMTPQTLGLLAALAWPIPMIAALFLVVRTKALKFRPVWAVISFVGVSAFWMERSTGKWDFIPVAINLLGPGSAPGFYKACVPVGALLVIALVLKVRSVRTTANAAAPQA
jgi:hypothetical protein